jgi:hypothetical protein
MTLETTATLRDHPFVGRSTRRSAFAVWQQGVVVASIEKHLVDPKRVPLASRFSGHHTSIIRGSTDRTDQDV